LATGDERHIDDAKSGIAETLKLKPVAPTSYSGAR
jgi:hypothetical protein